MIVRFTCFAAAMLAMSTAAVSIGGGESDNDFFCRRCEENKEVERKNKEIERKA